MIPTTHKVYFSVVNNINILQIPKNASSWIRHQAPSTELPTGKINVVILRDPIKRWVSGSVEYCMSKHAQQNNYSITNAVNVFFESKKYLDPHTWPQSWYLKKLPKLPTEYFSFDDDFFILTKFLGIENNIKKSSLKVNNSANDYRKTQLLNEFTKLSMQYKKELQELYIQDFELLSSIKFYKGT